MTDSIKHSSFVHRSPIISFYVLAFVLGGGTMFIVTHGVLPASMALSSALSASIAGIIIAGVLDRKAGSKWLFRRLCIWRVGIGY